MKQKFRALDQNVQNKSLPHYILDFKIAGAIINRYFNRLRSDAGYEELVARNMFSRCNKPNQLGDLEEKHGLHRKSQFQDIKKNELDDFPKLSLRTLTNEISLGSFQIKFGLSYITEFYKKTRGFSFMFD